jgi:hypothetical protein
MHNERQDFTIPESGLNGAERAKIFVAELQRIATNLLCSNSLKSYLECAIAWLKVKESTKQLIEEIRAKSSSTSVELKPSTELKPWTDLVVYYEYLNSSYQPSIIGMTIGENVLDLIAFGNWSVSTEDQEIVALLLEQLKAIETN